MVIGVKGNSESSYRKGTVNLTAANIGAAASSHNHDASNITSGTLPISRGGTGATIKFNALCNLGIGIVQNGWGKSLTVTNWTRTHGILYLNAGPIVGIWSNAHELIWDSISGTHTSVTAVESNNRKTLTLSWTNNSTATFFYFL